ncbi:hypothetical protein [Alienimonas californiensis]|uniref:Uncharacterized protein n=1 Tax=Alienimonas californiensis TaxID=2527989 RepID=A0A517P6U3_9PLAN|nr:hypothetical protein [Alienimonas californiensis]QDT15083.1 hypothetical protein CA12_11630 [Alienimonas californiensis]
MPRLPLPPRLAAAAGQLLLGLLADLAAVAAGRTAAPPDPACEPSPRDGR